MKQGMTGKALLSVMFMKIMEGHPKTTSQGPQALQHKLPLCLTGTGNVRAIVDGWFSECSWTSVERCISLHITVISSAIE